LPARRRRAASLEVKLSSKIKYENLNKTIRIHARQDVSPVVDSHLCGLVPVCVLLNSFGSEFGLVCRGPVLVVVLPNASLKISDSVNVPCRREQVRIKTTTTKEKNERKTFIRFGG